MYSTIRKLNTTSLKSFSLSWLILSCEFFPSLFTTLLPLLFQVATNGLLSFSEAFSHWAPEPFPGVFTIVQNSLLIAPFWDDVDISGGGGSVSYQIFSSEDNDSLANTNLNAVNTYVNSVHGDGSFMGIWMLVAYWNQVSPYPHGSFLSPVLFPDIYEVHKAFLLTLIMCM